MNDILPPKRPLNRQVTPRPPQQTTSRPTLVQPVPVASRQQPATLSPANSVKKKRSPKKWLLWVIGGVLAAIVLFVGLAIAWYVAALQPVNSTQTEKTSVQIVEGSSPGEIGQLLQDKGLIRSGLAFEVYIRLEGVRSKLQAGTYSLAPSESTQEIVTHLTSGNTDMVTVTFLPGATLAENKQVLLAAGFSEDEVDTALTKTYDSPLFASKPAGSDLEGYIYGETYTFNASVTVEEILEKTFAEFWRVIEQNNIVAGFEVQGLNLFEGITLASIVQREDANPDHQAQIAQVFYQRLKLEMTLGSDVTYYYGAKKLGVAPSSDLDTPYNTRLYPGLPPGPISSPGVSALIATAAPAEGDYLFFISGDDDILYMAHTNEEHEVNVQQHCQTKCQLP